MTNKHLYIPLGLFSVTVLSGALVSSSVFADNDTIIDQVNVTVPVSCTLSGTGMNTHNANIANGTYETNIGTTTLKAFCNDTRGFAIYAIGYTDNEEGKNVLTSSTLGDTYDIATGTATTGDTSNWAMKLSTISSPTPTYPITIQNSFDSFQQVPDDYTLVAKRTSGTDTGTNAEGSTLTTTYQAYISKTQPASTYTGQVKYTMVHPHDRVAPTKPRTSIDTATTLQEAEVCSSELTVGQAYTLVDSRDNEQYKVTKLADNNCWMLDNLRLDPTNPTIAANLSESNTNAPAAAITNFLSGGSTTTGWSSVEVTASTTFSYYSAYTEPKINNQYKNTVFTSFGEGSGKAGIYYNYCAATVGTICYERTYSQITEFDVPYDICPTNWHMPTANQYDVLVTQYSAPSSLQLALSISLSGGIDDSGLNSENNWGYYWTSTLNSDDLENVINLPVNDTAADWSGSHSRYAGDTIRCVLDSN